LTNKHIFVFLENRSIFFNDLYREVTVTGWDPEGATKLLQIVSAATGYTIPETGKTVLFIVHQSIFNPGFNHNFLSTMQMRLHDMVVNEAPNFQCLQPNELSHTIGVRGDDMDEVLMIPLELNGVVSCFLTFKPSQEEFDTCDRYEFTFESPEYDPSVKTFSEKEASMTYSWVMLKVTGDLHPKRSQVCTLHQKEMVIKNLTVKYSDTSAKLQDLSIVLNDSTLIVELNRNANISDLNVSSVVAMMRDNGVVDAAT
jgi:hypothetical protein